MNDNILIILCKLNLNCWPLILWNLFTLFYDKSAMTWKLKK